MAKKPNTSISKESAPKSAERPDVFRFHDYRTFLREWFDFKKKTQSGFSHRRLAEQANIALGYFSLVFSGSRHITMKTFTKLLPHLDLSPAEQTYLENLVKLQVADSQETRIDAMDRMRSMTPYQEKHPDEAKFIEYMSHWYHIFIRQMAILPGFKPDPHWIQSQLKVRVPLQEIKSALEFLFANGYLQLREDGTVVPPEDLLSCDGELYRTVLTQYHKQMFTLAMLSIDNTPTEERKLLGHTFNIEPSQFEEAQKIIDAAMAKIQELPGSNPRPSDSVYHVQLAIFPVTRKREEK